MIILKKRSASLRTPLVTLAGLALSLSPLVTFAGEGHGVSGIADREIARREARVQEALAAIARGDAAMKSKDCENALNEYKAALDGLPDAPMTAQWRDIAS